MDPEMNLMYSNYHLSGRNKTESRVHGNVRTNIVSCGSLHVIYLCVYVLHHHIKYISYSPQTSTIFVSHSFIVSLFGLRRKEAFTHQ